MLYWFLYISFRLGLVGKSLGLQKASLNSFETIPMVIIVRHFKCQQHQLLMLLIAESIDDHRPSYL